MSLNAWILSAKLAWSDRIMRWTTVFSLFVTTFVIVYFLIEVLPSAYTNKAFAFHYTIYNGIDNVKAWYWVFLLPGLWFSLTCVDILLAFGMYRIDQIYAKAIVLLMCGCVIPWTSYLVYHTFLNY